MDYFTVTAAYLLVGRFPQEVGTAGPARLGSDDLTEKTDWINIPNMRPSGIRMGFHTESKTYGNCNCEVSDTQRLKVYFTNYYCTFII